MRLRLSGLMHVAIRSPRPVSPANVRGSPPIATPRRVISASPRVITIALVLSPTPEALGHAGGDRDDVLERAAQLAAGHVGVRVDAEDRAGEDRLQRHGDMRRRAWR